MASALPCSRRRPPAKEKREGDPPPVAAAPPPYDNPTFSLSSSSVLGTPGFLSRPRRNRTCLLFPQPVSLSSSSSGTNFTSSCAQFL
ncbi:unnamed protein product [Linum tenue]|uniref:Uncharacterized protein n=1 Tax=Linum tenue TaxID=586396 RepID=A0AAV0R6Q1_9ROSI|nr:unnamed protein product [Linum tenue]CAI0552249.1 unnamed protein product [Linum tenue]